MNKKELTKFTLSLYGNITAFSETMSKARCRIFYKYGNRNGTYITDEFAEQLIASLPYAPIKGIYDFMEEDFFDHGAKRHQGRIYGVVPAEPNFAWEKHLDPDGIEREYACADVFLYTGIYEKEALDIINKSQSMELYADSIEGDWKFVDGKKYFVFTKGSFLGLQVLGDEFEPCFEGAAFYSLYGLLENFMNRLNEYENRSRSEAKGGKNLMNFKISDDQKYSMIWDLLNPDFNAENDYIINYFITDVYDDYAIAYNIEHLYYERVYYVKDDEKDSLEITKKEKCYIVDVNEEEKKALDEIYKKNNNTFEKIDVEYAALLSRAEDAEAQNSEFEVKIEDYTNQITTLQQEKKEVDDSLEEATQNFAKAQETIQTLTQERDSLSGFKTTVLKQEKETIIEHYSTLLEEEAINSFTERLDELTAEELEKELAYALVQSTPGLFTEGTFSFVPKDKQPTGIEGILDKYKK